MAAPSHPSLSRRLAIAAGVLSTVRRRELRSARRLMGARYGQLSPIRRFSRFTAWTTGVLWHAIPESAGYWRIDRGLTRIPYWLSAENPLAGHPWRQEPEARLPGEADVVTIGAGLAGAAVAYHWSRRAHGEMLVLEKDDPASGAAGRNAGMLVMAGGSYHGYYVYEPVLSFLAASRPRMSSDERAAHAEEFAAAYVTALEAGHEMIRDTIEREGIDCEYQRSGLVIHTDEIDRPRLEESLALARKRGWKDYIPVPRAEVGRRAGLRTSLDGACSQGGATWHPAKWVWGLLRASMTGGVVRLYTRTRVLGVRAVKEGFVVETTRGPVRARAVVNATEAHTGALFASFLAPYPELIRAHKSQAMYARGRPEGMVPGVGVLGPLGWFHPRSEDGFLFGSDNVRIPLRQAEGNDPSRFITLFMCSEATRLWPPESFTVVHEWTGTVGQAPDKFPVVGELSVPGLWTLGGFAGAGSAAAFPAGLHVVNGILGEESRPNYHPERFFSPNRFRSWARYGVAPL